jgi:hypothetical protein
MTSPRLTRRRLNVGEFVLIGKRVLRVLRVGPGSATVEPVDPRHATFVTPDGGIVEFDAPAGRMTISPYSEVQRVDPAEVEAMAKRNKAIEKKAKNETVPPKPGRGPKDLEATKVFAFRLTPAESAAIHKTAGPRNATRFVRQVAAAFATEDEAAFREAIKAARDART